MFRDLIQALDDLTDDEFQTVLALYRARADQIKALRINPCGERLTIPVDFTNADPTLAKFYAPQPTSSEQGDG